MTQITPEEIARHASGEKIRPWQDSLPFSLPLLIIMAAIFLAGIAAGRIWGRRRDGERGDSEKHP